MSLDIVGLDDTAPHPSAEDLLAYHEGELQPVEQESVAEHLVGCRDCAGVVLGLVAMDVIEAEPSLAEDWVSDATVESQWTALSSSTVSDPTPGWPGSTHPVRTARRLAGLAVAASLVLCAGMSWWILSLRDQLRQPRPNVFVQDLVPWHESQLRGSTGTPLSIPTGSEHILLLFNVSDLTFPATVSLEILDPDGRRIWRGDDVHRSRDGNYTLELPRHLLKAGRYRCLLIDPRPGQTPSQLEYVLEIADEYGRESEQ